MIPGLNRLGNNCLEWIKTKSLYAAIKSQRLLDLYRSLEKIVPDITQQYSSFVISSDYLYTKVRGMHAFQIYLVQKALQCLQVKEPGGITFVDIGDSAGTHLQYLQGMYGSIKALGINLDVLAVEKIKEKGLHALQVRAEDLNQYSIEADFFMSFEMLEHLSDPIEFLRKISYGTRCKGMVITVPYLSESRVGLHHLRHSQNKVVSAENTHIFELSPGDWRLIFKHAGWAVVFERVYYQYPSWGLCRLARSLWRRTDFEGFYGAVLRREFTWSCKYGDWRD